MRIDEEFWDVSNPMVYSSAAFTDDFVVKYADDFFYNFVGKQVGIKFTEIVHENYLEEFTNAALSAKSGEKVRIVTVIKGADALYHVCDVTFTDSGRRDGAESLIDVQIYGLYSMAYRYNSTYDYNTKYKTFLSMYHDYLFDYDSENDMLTLLYYDSVKATIVIKDSFEAVRDKIGKLFEEMGEDEKFYKFFDSIKNSNEGSVFEFDGPDIADQNHRVHYTVNTRVAYKLNRSKIVIGIVDTNDKDSNVAIYDKPEGRDFFTGLYSKKACEALVNDTIKMASGNLHYMIMMDVDNFKNINDLYGHLCGDQVILKMAEILNKAVAGRGVVGRFGGDEFFIFTKSVESETALRSMLTYIKKAMKQEFQDQFGGDGLTASMGVVAHPAYGDTYDNLFKKADKCLYIAKEKGKNRFIIYDPVKHGDVEEENGAISTGIGEIKQHRADVAEGVSNIILKLTGSSYGLGRAIIDLADILGVDGIRVYTKSYGELLTRTGKYHDLSKIEPLIFSEQYDKLFEGKEFTSLSLVGNLELLDGEIYKACVAAGIDGYLGCKHTTRFGDEIRVFFDNMGRKMNATQTEKEMMLLITAVIAGTFEG